MGKYDIEKQRMNHSNLKDILPDVMARKSIIDNKQFSSANGRVLRFYGILDNPDEQYEILRKFIIHVIELFKKNR